MTARTIVVKIGGSTLGSGDTTFEDLVALQRAGARPVVVHGGGKVITEWLERSQLPTRFVRGLRVTDEPALCVVTAVLAGLVNKELVAKVQALGGKAIGLCGVDGALVQVHQRDPELGFVGDVTGFNLDILRIILDAGYLPIVAPIGLDEHGQHYNINADTVAGGLALAVRADDLIFLTDVPGIRDGSGQVVTQLSRDDVEMLIAEGVIASGMIPKTQACLCALGALQEAQIVDGRVPHALLASAKGEAAGTRIVRG
ncbi:MAG: acetylglutamate kinase [Chloroflexota bacterium]|nr:MAG: acetylglutamate kinase [Chloroflexota bacterium]